MNDKKTKISVFATYWNEKNWIEASLAQIDAINPHEVIICDGCFDPSKPNYSTDGTREIIEKWVEGQPTARMISASRHSKIGGLFYIFGKKIKFRLLPVRVLMFFYYLHTNIYRINQAATFNKMSRMSKFWKPGNWFMTLDADQFYPDEMIEKFKQICDTKETTVDLITASEMTFFKNFNEFTTEYDKRNYNNMPHRIKKYTLIVPTRDIVVEKYPRPKAYGKDPSIRKQDVGSYFHYKFRLKDQSRTKVGNTLGDRKDVDSSRFSYKKFKDTHPTVIRNS